VDLDDHDWPVTRPLSLEQAKMTWLRNTIELPEFVEGYRIEGARVDLTLRVWGRSIVYVNGSQVSAFNYDNVVIPLTASAKAGEKFCRCHRTRSGSRQWDKNLLSPTLRSRPHLAAQRQ